MGTGSDAQIYEPCINAILWRANLPWDPVLRIFEARVDIFSFPGWSILYPFRWAFSYGSILPYKELLTSTTAILFVHQVCASLTFFMLLKGLRCRPLYAAFGGMGYAYSLHLLNWSSWLAAFTGFTWLPLCLLGIILITKKKRYLLGSFTIAVGYTLVLLASSFAFIYTLVLSIIFFLATIPSPHNMPNAIVKPIVFVGLGGLLGAMAGATSLIPTFTRSSEYIRWFTGGHVKGGMQIPYDGTLVSPIDKWGILHLIFPLDYGNNLGNVFVGMSILFLSGYLFITCRKLRRFTAVLLMGAIYFLLDAMGDATFIHHLTYHVPFLNSIRYPISGGIVVVVCLLTTGLLGAEKLSQSLAKGQPHKRTGVYLLMFGIVDIIFLLFFRNELNGIYKANIGFNILILSVAGGIIAASMLIANKKKLSSIIPFVLLISFFPMNTLIVQTKILNQKNSYLNCAAFRELTEALPRWRQELGEHTRIATLLDKKRAHSNCLFKLNISDSLLNSVAMASGWDVSTLYLSPRPVREFYLFNQLARWESLKKYNKLLQAGITHVLSNLPPDEVPSFYKKIKNRGPFYLYAIEGSRMGLNITGCINKTSDIVQIINNIGRRNIIIKPSDLNELINDYSCTSQNGIPIDAINFARAASGTTISYHTKSSSNLLLVTDRVFSRNWQVQVNGKLVAPIVVDGYRLAVKLEGGVNNIVLKYRPTDFFLSAIISMFGVFFILSIGLYLISYSLFEETNHKYVSNA